MPAFAGMTDGFLPYIHVIPANGHDTMVTTKHESQLSHQPVIPACFWRESRKSSLDTRLRGYDGKDFHTKPASRKI
jgi:hypothetical protein